MPDLGGQGGDSKDENDPVRALNAAVTFPAAGSVAFWNLGTGLGRDPLAERRKDELKRVRAIQNGLRERPSDFPRLATAVLDGDFPKYATPGQSLDLLGVEAQSWAGRDPLDTFPYLVQRRQLTALRKIGAPYWAWVTVSSPALVRTAVWGDDAPPPWGTPRVQPEQVRLGVYEALMAGYRGVGYRADADLTRPPGRAVLYELALLNAELDLVEPILAQGTDPIPVLSVFPPDPAWNMMLPGMGPNGAVGQGMGMMGQAEPSVSQGQPMMSFKRKPPAEVKPHKSIRAAAISTRDGRGRLLVITDLAPGAQWQPPQMAMNDLNLTVPGVPDDAQAFVLTFGGIKVLDQEHRKRQPGGLRLTLEEFDTTALILLTTDFPQADRLKQSIQAIRPRAVDLALKEAQIQLEWVSDLNGRLARDGHTVVQAAELLGLAGRMLQSARDAQAREDYPLAWDESRRVLRPLRMLMRSHFDQAVAAMSQAATVAARGRTAPSQAAPEILVPPVASPAALAFNTLPQHYVWCDWVRTASFGANLLPSGGFDGASPDALSKAGWTDPGYQDSKLKTTVELVPPAGRDKSARSASSSSRWPRPIRTTSTTARPSWTTRPPPCARRRSSSRGGSLCGFTSSSRCRARCPPARADSSSATPSAASCSSTGRPRPSPTGAK